jgi:hypothetical protein
MHEPIAPLLYRQGTNNPHSTSRRLPDGFAIPRRRRITRPFNAFPVDAPMGLPRWLRPAAEYITKLCTGRGRSFCVLAHLALAEELSCHEAHAAKMIYALRDLGWLTYKPRRIPGTRRNFPNLYRLPHLMGFFADEPIIAKRVRKVSMDADRVKELNTNTSTQNHTSTTPRSDEPRVWDARQAPSEQTVSKPVLIQKPRGHHHHPHHRKPGPSYHRLKVEYHREQARQAGQAKRRLVAENALARTRRLDWEARQTDTTPRCSGTPQTFSEVELAAGHVMTCIGVKPSLHRTRAAIAEALENWLMIAEGRAGGLAAAVNAMVAAWKDYDTLNYPRKFRFQPIGFYAGNHWTEGSWAESWGLDVEAMASETRASVGTSKPEPKVDMAALKAKMAALLASYPQDDFEDDEEGSEGRGFADVPRGTYGHFCTGGYSPIGAIGAIGWRLHLSAPPFAKFGDQDASDNHQRPYPSETELVQDAEDRHRYEHHEEPRKETKRVGGMFLRIYPPRP